jgi:hypothetical protein
MFRSTSKKLKERLSEQGHATAHRNSSRVGAGSAGATTNNDSAASGDVKVGQSMKDVTVKVSNIKPTASSSSSNSHNHGRGSRSSSNGSSSDVHAKQSPDRQKFTTKKKKIASLRNALKKEDTSYVK